MAESWRDAGEMEVWMQVSMNLIKNGSGIKEAAIMADTFVQECRNRRPVIQPGALVPIKK